jgi:lipopolysaccharide transport protein LptA
MALDGGMLVARPVQVSADRLEVLNHQQRAVYSGHAKVVRDTTTLTCDSLVVEYGKNRTITRIMARGNVIATDQDRWGRGDEADYDPETGVLVLRGDPQARQGTRHVRGNVVTFTTGTDRIVIEGAKTAVEDEKGFVRDAGTSPSLATITIDADRLVLDDQRSQAVWSGHVVAKRGDTTVLTPQLTAFYNPSGTITKVQARGGVEASEKDRWAKGQRGDYDLATGVLVVTGQPQARQGKNRMKGTKVTFSSGSDVIEVENATTIIEVPKETSRRKP